MSAPTSIDALPADELQRLHAVLDQFEAAITQNSAADLTQFLPPKADPKHRIYLIELAKADIFCRCRTGDERLVEGHLYAWPELRSNAPDLLALVWEEYQARRRHRPQDLKEYERRFPEVFASLQQKIETASNISTPASPSADAANDHTRTKKQPVPPIILMPNARPNLGVSDRVLSVGGGYRLQRRIGSGSFGEVWRAEAPGEIPVAVKIITRPLDHDEAKRELSALELIKKIAHPFLLSTQAFWPLEERLVIVMELADGSFSDRLAQVQAKGLKGIPVPELLAGMREACEAIDFLHEKRIIHRDVKPANILTLGKHIKVADFGLARAHQLDPTMQKTTSGTPAYMAPELWHGDPAVPASDLYALAATYFELRLGRRLFADTGMVQMMLSHIESEPNLKELEPDEATAVRKALAKDPKQRHKTCMEFWRELREALDPVRMATEVGPDSITLPNSALHTPLRRPTRESETQNYPPPALRSAQAPTWRTGDFPRRKSRRGRWLVVFAMLVLAGGGSFGAWKMGLFNLQMISEGLVRSKNDNSDTGDSGPKLGVLPPGFEPVPGNGEVTIGGRIWPKRIVKKLRGDIGPDFALVVSKNNAVDPFYMMRTKVWNQLLRSYRKEFDIQADGTPFLGVGDVWRICMACALQVSFWSDPEWPSLPAYFISVDEAQEFAKRLGGSLPTVAQWDAAAGLEESTTLVGPFLGTNTTFLPGEFALTTPMTQNGRPRPVETSTRDQSPYECRDMASNGYEWTRNIEIHDGINDHPVPFSEKDKNVTVVIRSHSFNQTLPYRFADAGMHNQPRFDETTRQPLVRQDIGFRVAIRLP